MTAYVRCKYCAWQTSRWGKDGKPTGGKRLESHVIAEHADAFAHTLNATSLQAYLDREEADDEWLDERNTHDAH